MLQMLTIIDKTQTKLTIMDKYSNKQNTKTKC